MSGSFTKQWIRYWSSLAVYLVKIRMISIHLRMKLDVMRRYDYKQSFDSFLYSCLSNKIKTEITRRNREKRKADRMSVSLEAGNEDNEESCMLNLTLSDFNTFEEVLKLQENERYQDKIKRYLSKLSSQQVNILNLLIDDYKP